MTNVETEPTDIELVRYDQGLSEEFDEVRDDTTNIMNEVPNQSMKLETRASFRDLIKCYYDISSDIKRASYTREIQITRLRWDWPFDFSSKHLSNLHKFRDGDLESVRRWVNVPQDWKINLTSQRTPQQTTYIVKRETKKNPREHRTIILKIDSKFATACNNRNTSQLETRDDRSEWFPTFYSNDDDSYTESTLCTESTSM